MIKKLMNKIKITNSNINNSIVGNTYNIDIIDNNIQNVIMHIGQEISSIRNLEMKTQLDTALYSIRSFYNKEKDEFIRLLFQSACSVESEPTAFQITNIIKFWLITKYYDTTIDFKTISKNMGKIKINNNNTWIMAPGKLSPQSIEKSIAQVIYFLKIGKLDSVNNGNCYLSKLSPSSSFGCHNCNDGYIDISESSKVIDDFVESSNREVEFDNDNNELPSDFISLHTKRNIKMKCGNCVTDIEKLKGNIDKLIV